MTTSVGDEITDSVVKVEDEKTPALPPSKTIFLDEARGKNLDMDIDTGTQLQIELGFSNRKFSSVMIGRKPWEYLVIRTPEEPEILSGLHVGNQIVVRYVHNGLGRIFGFRSFIQSIVHTPVRLILLDYPKFIETHNVRKESRVGCFYLVRAEVNGNTYNGVVTNINTCGCAFAFHSPASASDDDITIQEVMTSNNKNIFPDEIPKLKCSIRLGEAAEIYLEQLAGPIPILGNFRHVTLDRGKVVCGVEFENLDLAVSEQILGYRDSVEKHVGRIDVWR